MSAALWTVIALLVVIVALMAIVMLQQDTIDKLRKERDGRIQRPWRRQTDEAHSRESRPLN